MNRFITLTLIFGFLAGSVLPSAFAADYAHLKLYTTRGSFDDIRQDVEIAIAGRGLVVDHISHISAMLERTGKGLAPSGDIFKKAESLQFCSGTVSRSMMQTDSSNIVFCPYSIVVYSLPTDPEKVYVGYRRPELVGSEASKASLKEVEDLIDGIIKEALNLK